MLSITTDKIKKIFSLLLVTVLLFSSFVVDIAAVTDAQKQQYKNEIAEIKKEIEENKKKIEALGNEASQYDDDVAAIQEKMDAVQKQIDLFNKEIALIDKDINVIDAQINDVQKEIDALNKQVEELDVQIQTLEDEKEATYKLLGERIRASYMSGASSSLEFLLTSDDFHFQSYLERVELLRRIAQHDDELVKQLEKNIEDINKKLTEIEDVKTRLASKIAELDSAKDEYESKKQEQVDARGEVEAKEAEIQKDLNKVQGIINGLNKQSKEYQAAIDKREEAILKLEDKLSQENTYYGSGVAGKMSWPMPYENTYISSSFKLRTLNGSTRRHNGIDVCLWGGTQGANIIAVDDGTVVKASWGWNGGYGNLITINHGNGVVTYYAHLSNIRVSTGQSVKKGVLIGNAGNTGYSTGAHLHFGIMINGNWVNPVNYLHRYTPGGKYITSVDNEGRS